MRLNDSKQPHFEERIGPWVLTVYRGAIEGRRGAFKGWRTEEFFVIVRHKPTGFELSHGCYRNTDRDSLVGQLDEDLAATGLTRFFVDQPTNAKQIILDLVDALLNPAPARLTSCHE